MTANSADQAVANGRDVSTYPKGYCQKFVRAQCWEVGSLYGSAIEAWNGAAEKHPGDRNPPNGAPCYYRGGNYGHAVISVGGGRIRSTDCESATNVNDTDLGWPERSWGYEYLGWTGDINGVDLPVGKNEGDDDMPLSDDDVQKVANAVWDKLLSGQPDTNKDRKAWATLVNAFSSAYDASQHGAKNVWQTKLMGQKDAPDGRYASATLSNIHNMLVELSKRQ